jgi:hypothetical protein
MRQTNHSSPRKNFYLSMLSESDNTAEHEMSTSDHGPFHCVRFAGVRSVTTALSGESQPAIWRRSDRDRKGFDPTFCKTSACYSAKVRAVSATNTEAFACVIKAFSPVFPELIISVKQAGAGIEPKSRKSELSDDSESTETSARNESAVVQQTRTTNRWGIPKFPNEELPDDKQQSVCPPDDGCGGSRLAA